MNFYSKVKSDISNPPHVSPGPSCQASRCQASLKLATHGRLLITSTMNRVRSGSGCLRRLTLRLHPVGLTAPFRWHHQLASTRLNCSWLGFCVNKNRPVSLQMSDHISVSLEMLHGVTSTQLRKRCPFDLS